MLILGIKGLDEKLIVQQVKFQRMDESGNGNQIHVKLVDLKNEEQN